MLVAFAVGNVNYSYFNWSKNTETGKDLKQTLIEEKDLIIVTHWYKHLRHESEQNKRNLIVEGSLKNLISRCHPKVRYTEANLSAFNINSYTFRDYADEWKIDLTALDDGPIIMVLYQQKGTRFWCNSHYYFSDK